MPTKRRGAKPSRKPVSEKTRAEDERLRDELRHADMRKLDKTLERAIHQRPRPNG